MYNRLKMSVEWWGIESLHLLVLVSKAVYMYMPGVRSCPETSVSNIVVFVFTVIHQKNTPFGEVKMASVDR